MSKRWMILCMFLFGCAHVRGASMPEELAAALRYEGPNRTKVDLLRTSEGGPRIYVQAVFPDGSKGLFLVDTGAAVSVLSYEVADRLGLEVQKNAAEISGLNGRAKVGGATLTSLNLGDAVLHDVHMVVGVPGVPSHAVFMPQAGILGNNVWQHFIMEIDYPADLLVLHRPGTARPPRSATPVFFDGDHVHTPIEVTALDGDGAVGTTDLLILKLDTGATELMVSAESGQAFEDYYSEGVEAVYGLGASEFMPPSMFLSKTRRIPVQSYVLGGRHVDRPLQAQWLNFDHDGLMPGPTLMRGLIGHRMLTDYRVWLDYQQGLLALTHSRRHKRQINGHSVLLRQDLEMFGEDAPDRQLFRARMLFAMDRATQAKTGLEAHVQQNPSDAGAQVLLAKVRRNDGDLSGAWDALEGLSAAQLVEEGEIIAAVNGLLLEERLGEATALATRAVLAVPDDSDARIAVADAHLAAGSFDMANTALLESARLRQNPDANLLRRARISMAEGDRHGALAKVRQLVRLYPTSGKFLWFYATLVQSGDETETFRRDVQAITARQHPTLLPLDFLLAAQHAAGDEALAQDYLAKGLSRDCSPLDGAARDNCTAWFYALGGVHLDQALSLIEHAIDKEGQRADYLDTLATVRLARGELREAHEAAVSAARLSPDDVYMLWQAERIAQLGDQRKDGGARR